MRRARVASPTYRALLGSSESHEPEVNVIGGQWSVRRKLGSGAFGTVYLVQCVRSGNTAAVKIATTDSGRKQLRSENRVYAAIHQASHTITGIAKPLDFEMNSDYAALVFKRLGPSLEDLLDRCNRSMSIGSVYQIAIQLLRRIEVVHNADIIHRDIKPANLLMGLSPEESTLYIVDFGLAKRFRDQETKEHIPRKTGKEVAGTVRFCSVNTHRGIEQSRRDDLESIGYTLIYLHNGQLPWQGLPRENERERRDHVKLMKQSISDEDLFANMGTTILYYFRYVRSLPFERRPDYSFLRRLFRSGLERRGLSENGIFDWMLSPRRRGARRSPRRF